MVVKLKLVANTPEYAQKTAENTLNLPINDLVPKRGISEVAVSDASSSYTLMIAVIVAHALGVSVLFTSRPAINEIEILPVTMTVSLVSNSTSAPEVTPVKPVIKQPKIKQQQPLVAPKTVVAPKLVKQKIDAIPEPATESVIENSVTQEAIVARPTVENSSGEPVDKAEQATAEPTVSAKAEAEPVTEPPRFGAAYLNNPAPAYPPMARRLGEQGRVLLNVLVSASGHAEKIQIENGSGYSKLDQAAIEAVKQWTFVPAKRSHQAISAYVLVPIKFSLNN